VWLRRYNAALPGDRGTVAEVRWDTSDNHRYVPTDEDAKEEKVGKARDARD
jgi:hypothetical protein